MVAVASSPGPDLDAALVAEVGELVAGSASRWKSLPTTVLIRLRSPIRNTLTVTAGVLTLTSGMPRWPVRGST